MKKSKFLQSISLFGALMFFIAIAVIAFYITETVAFAEDIYCIEKLYLTN